MVVYTKNTCSGRFGVELAHYGDSQDSGANLEKIDCRFPFCVGCEFDEPFRKVQMVCTDRVEKSSTRYVAEALGIRVNPKRWGQTEGRKSRRQGSHCAVPPH